MLSSRFILSFLALTLLSLNHSFSQKIGLLMDSYVVDRWVIDEKLLRDKIADLGGESVVEVAYGDTTTQTTLARKLITEGVDALIVVPVDSKKAAEIAHIAKAANVPLIAYDRSVLSDDVSLFVSYNNYKVGVLQATAALKHVKKGKFLLVNGPLSDNNAVEFRNGQLSVLRPHIDDESIEIIGDIVLDNWGELQAFLATDEFLQTTHSKIDCVIAGNDAVANGVISALDSHNARQSDVYITGQDADLVGIANIVKGIQGMTVYKPIKPLAHLAAEAAIKLAKGEVIENTTSIAFENSKINATLLDPLVVDKSNYKETVIKDGHVKLSEVLER